jgi:hypothetical protein
MPKYKIEGNIDFFSELYKSLDIDDEEKNDIENNLCLITNEPLNDKFVKMECGHTFNYIPLYLDIKNHKQKFNGMEGSSTHLKQNEIRCPYCRKKQVGVLPYHEDLNLIKIHGVNDINPTFQEKKIFNSYNYQPCKFLTPNPNYDASGNSNEEYNSSNKGNCKFFICFNSGTQINYCNGNIEGENYGDNNHYCWNHKKIVVKKYKKEILDKAKEEAKIVKQKKKEETKKLKEEEKQKEKEEKQKEKEEKQKEKEEKQKEKEDANKAKEEKKQENGEKSKKKIVSSENIVLGPNNITIDEPMLGCITILKSGSNKGNKCNCKIYNENMCKRHFNSNLIIEK